MANIEGNYAGLTTGRRSTYIKDEPEVCKPLWNMTSKVFAS